MIDVTTRNGVALLTLGHGKANVLDAEFAAALAVQLEASARADCRAVVITGRGTIFSAGVDLVRVVSDGEPYIRRFLPVLTRLLRAAFEFPKPLVAAVNGHAIAGGCILACAADYRVMARGSGRIGVPELLVGVPFPPVPLEVLRFVVPPPLLQRLVFEGTTLTADAAVAHGLVDVAVEADRVLDDAIAKADALAAQPPAAFTSTKCLLRAPTVARMREGLATSDAAVIDLWCSAPMRGAVKQYIDRTLKKQP